MDKAYRRIFIFATWAPAQGQNPRTDVKSLPSPWIDAHVLIAMVTVFNPGNEKIAAPWLGGGEVSHLANSTMDCIAVRLCTGAPSAWLVIKGTTREKSPQLLLPASN